MKSFNDNIGNRTCDLPVCSAVPQPTVKSEFFNVLYKVELFYFIRLVRHSNQEAITSVSCVGFLPWRISRGNSAFRPVSVMALSICCLPDPLLRPHSSHIHLQPTATEIKKTCFISRHCKLPRLNDAVARWMHDYGILVRRKDHIYTGLPGSGLVL
jgi:hypothetical protein